MNRGSSSRIVALIVAFVLLIIASVILYFNPGVLPLSSIRGNSSPAAVGSVDQFKDTEIVAHPDAPLDPNKNVVWCGTLALAWNEAPSVFKGPLLFAPPIPLANLLNRHEFTDADLDSESYVALAGRKVDQVKEKFRAEIHRKFGDNANPPELDSADPPAAPEDVAIYAYLLKNLAFTDPFNNNIPLSFAGKQVANFGFGFEKNHYSEAQNLSSEVKLLAYTSDDNFAIQLKTKNEGDQLILAKIPPEPTLQKTIDAVLTTIKPEAPWGLDDMAKLAIPKIDFDLTSHFKQLENQNTISGSRLYTVAENIVFRLNEKGVELKVFSTITGTLAVSNMPPPRLVFDKPFLVLLKRTNSPRPYFAMWVGNPTLLVKP